MLKLENLFVCAKNLVVEIFIAVLIVTLLLTNLVSETTSMGEGFFDAPKRLELGLIEASGENVGIRMTETFRTNMMNLGDEVFDLVEDIPYELEDLGVPTINLFKNSAHDEGESLDVTFLIATRGIGYPWSGRDFDESWDVERILSTRPNWPISMFRNFTYARTIDGKFTFFPEGDFPELMPNQYMNIYILEIEAAEGYKLIEGLIVIDVWVDENGKWHVSGDKESTVLSTEFNPEEDVYFDRENNEISINIRNIRDVEDINDGAGIRLIKTSAETIRS